VKRGFHISTPKHGETVMAEEKWEDRMIKWFAFEHLPEHLRDVSAAFHKLAQSICFAIDPGPERTVALRKLLEAKDAAVRATVHPGG